MIAQYHPTWQLVVGSDGFDHIIEAETLFYKTQHDGALLTRWLQFHQGEGTGGAGEVLRGQGKGVLRGQVHFGESRGCFRSLHNPAQWYC